MKAVLWAEMTIYFKDIVPFHLLPTVNTKVLAIILQYISPKTQQNKNDCTNQWPVATLPQTQWCVTKDFLTCKGCRQVHQDQPQCGCNMFQIIVVAILWRLAINEVCLGFSTMEASHTY